MENIRRAIVEVGESILSYEERMPEETFENDTLLYKYHRLVSYYADQIDFLVVEYERSIAIKKFNALIEVPEKIKQIQEYFKDKILKGEFEVIDCGDHTMSIKIDTIYSFVFWMSNGRDYCVSNSHCGTYSFINLSVRSSERRRMYKILAPFWNRHKETIRREEKIKQFNKLKKELYEEV